MEVAIGPVTGPLSQKPKGLAVGSRLQNRNPNPKLNLNPNLNPNPNGLIVTLILTSVTIYANSFTKAA